MRGNPFQYRTTPRPAVHLSSRSLLVCILACGLLFPVVGKDRDQRVSFLEAVGISAKNALFSPATWAPAAASALFYVSGLDPVVSDWATTHTPLYGSVDAAGRASDFFLKASRYEFYATTALAYATTTPRPSLAGAAVGIGGSYAAVGLTGAATGLLKVGAGRLRPDGSDYRSFPSGHTSMATVYATLACRNAEMIRMPRSARLLFQGAMVGTAVATAWGRVEGAHHYPADVLAGAALGHFVGAFASELMWRMGFPWRATIIPEFSRDGLGVEVSMPIPGGHGKH